MSANTPENSKRLVVELGEVNEKNVGQFKLLNSVVLPVTYNAQFYNTLVRSHLPELVRLAYYSDIPVGAVACRLEPKENNPAIKRLYIMTLGVIAPYRSQGIGSQLLEYILNWCEGKTDMEDIYLHVQTSNESAINFYKRHNFTVTGKLEKYYKRIEPPDCFILSRPLTAAQTKSA